MIKRWTIAITATGILTVGAGIAMADSACCGIIADSTAQEVEIQAEQSAVALKAQTMCPIMGRPIRPDMFVDHEGKRIYVCCKGCIRQVQADPEAALAKISEMGMAVEIISGDVGDKCQTGVCNDINGDIIKDKCHKETNKEE